MQRLKLLSLPVIVSLLAASAYAADSRDNVESVASDKVYSTSGECVRTQWQAADDACAPYAPPPVAAPEPPPPPPRVILDQRTIYFDFNKTNLSEAAISKLDNLVNIILHSKGIYSATVLGYADAIGSDGYNLKLSQQRAAVVQEYLASRVSIPTNILMVSGKGETGSVTHCPEKMKRAERINCLAKDRRVEIEFNYLKAPI